MRRASVCAMVVEGAAQGQNQLFTRGNQVRLYPGCVRALGRGLIATLVVLCSTLAVGAGSATAGQIVYAHGGDLWVMNDNGTGQRPLATASQLGAPLSADNSGDQALSVQPGGTGIALVTMPSNGCPNTFNCPALYSLIGGQLTRLTGPQSPCNTGGSCGSMEYNPAVTSDGRVVYEHDFVANSYPCYYYCGGGSALSQQYMVRKLDGSDAPVAWPIPPAPSLPAPNGDDTSVQPRFSGPPASDPVNPSVLAYQGNAFPYDPQAGYPTTTQFPLDLDHTSTNPASATQPATAGGFIWGLAFSQDGSLVADVESNSDGSSKGIWVYPSGQTWQSSGSAFRSYWALADPDNNDGSQFDHGVTGLTFVGNNELVFSANYNLYSIPASCWATNTTGSTANCSLSQATQLTHDGTSSAPDMSPSWTSSTTPIAAFALPTTGGGGGSGGGSGGSGGGSGGGTPTTGTGHASSSDQISGLRLAAGAVRSGKPVTFEVTLKTPAGIRIQILRLVPASGHGKHRRRAHYVLVGTVSYSGKSGSNRVLVSRLHGHKLQAGAYRAQVSAGGATHVVSFRVRH